MRADPPVLGKAVIGDLLRSNRLLIPIAVSSGRKRTTRTNDPIHFISWNYTSTNPTSETI